MPNLLKCARNMLKCTDLPKFAKIKESTKMCHFNINMPKICGCKFPEGQDEK